MGKVRYPLISDHLEIRPENEENIWDEKWSVRLKGKSGESIGHISFAGGKIAGEIPISVELEPEYQNKGYGAEIFSFMARFLFRFRSVREVTANCADDNDRCIKALEKAGYVCREHENRKYYYSIKKSKPVWTGIYLVIGLIAGMIIGIVFSNLWGGTAFGVIVGLICGYLLDKREDPDGNRNNKQDKI